MDRNYLIGVLALGAALCVGIMPAAAADGSLLGTWKNWSAYASSAGGKQVCYALSTPRASEPRGAKRGPIYFLVNDWPDRRVKAEPETVAGYPYKTDAPVTVEIGSDKFSFFGRVNGGEGDAWLRSLGDEQNFIDTMQKSPSMVVSGTSARGTVTQDTYSLDGFGDALSKIHAACRM